ncbi:MAG: DNA ligase [Desulfovermiculus sp.]|nr:DNA ligase [Desulfovermiculus sp.]
MVAHNGRKMLFIIILAVFFADAAIGLADSLDLRQYKNYTKNEDISGWYMSEKLDGIRGYWDGENLLTRSGRTIHAPGWFTHDFPEFELDGELWAGRGNFHLVQKTVLDTEPSSDWKRISYNIFEVPHAPGDFSARLKKAKEWFGDHNCAHVRVIPQITCLGHKHLQRFLQKIEAQKGEGVIVKDPQKSYSGCTSAHVLKVKSFEELEGTVIGINPGKGKFKNMMGSLTIALKNGETFKLGTGFTREQRKDPPGIGSQVRCKHYGWTRHDKPRFASFLQVINHSEAGE